MDYFESTPYILNQKLDFIKRENRPSLDDYYQTYDNLNTTLPDMKYHFSYLKKQVKGLNDSLNTSFFGNFSTNSTIMNNTYNQSFFTMPNNNFSYQVRYNENNNIPNYQNNYNYNSSQINSNYINNNMNNFNNLNNQFNSNNNFQHPILNNFSYQMKSTLNNENNNFSPSSVGGIISNDLEKGVQERNLILDKYEELFKEGYNKLTNLKNENSALKQNLNKFNKDYPKSNEENEDEEKENDNDNNNEINQMNEIQTALKNKNIQNFPQKEVKIDWVELKNINDEINNLRKENLKNQEKYEIKLNELKNKIDQLEIRIESQNH